MTYVEASLLLVMADRKAELEKKRKKLDELRKARELKKNAAVWFYYVWITPFK